MPPWTAVGERTTSTIGYRRREHGADVVPHRAHRRGRDTDAARPARSGRLRDSSNRPSAASLARRASYWAWRSPAPDRGDRLDVELVDTLRLVGAHPAMAHQLGAVLGANGGPRQLLAEQDRPDLAVRVLQGEEAMSRRRVAWPTDLALDPDIGQGLVGVEQATDPAIEIGYAPDARPSAARALRSSVFCAHEANLPVSIGPILRRLLDSGLVLAGPGVDPEQVALVDEQRYVDHEPGLEGRRLAGAGGGVTGEPRFGARDP